MVAAFGGAAPAAAQTSVAQWDGTYDGNDTYVNSEGGQNTYKVRWIVSNGKVTEESEAGGQAQGTVDANGSSTGSWASDGNECNWKATFTPAGGTVSIAGNYTCTHGNGSINLTRTSAPPGTPSPSTGQPPAGQPPAGPGQPPQPQPGEQKTDPVKCEKAERRIKALQREIRKFQASLKRAKERKVKESLKQRIANRRKRQAEVRRNAKRYCALRPVPG